MIKRKSSALALAVMLAASTMYVGAAESAKAILADGATTATESGHIKGKESADYTLQGHAGQTLHAKITNTGTASYFDVVPPGGGEPIFYGARVGDEFTGALPADGEYTLHVHLAGRDAMNGEQADFSLTVDIK